jgi:D-lactate dehydrogenase (cytochrome)
MAASVARIYPQWQFLTCPCCASRSSVPLSHLPALLEATAADVRAEGIVGPCFGHAGDGSFHCILPVSDNDPPAYWERVHRVNANLLRRTLAVGGTCTGEHGVGAGKIPYLEEQYGPGAVHAMKLIKQSLDPYGLMNPGKVVDMS